MQFSKAKFWRTTVEDIEITSVNIQMTHNKSNEFLKYGIGYIYKGEKHSSNFITVKKDNKLYDLDYLKKHIVENTMECNGKFLTGLLEIDKKILGGLL